MKEQDWNFQDCIQFKRTSMCRLLLINSENEFDIAEYLHKFAELAKNSKEYQGDGWGICYYKKNVREFYHSQKPIWEDNLDLFGRSNLILVHARSAFNDALKPIEHNMPFLEDKYSFAFNGELRRVKLKVKGRIGAEKIFNFIKTFDKNGLLEAIKKSNKIIEKRTEYIRAMNYIILDSDNIYINSFYNEDTEYFSLQKKETGSSVIVCSEKFPTESGWEPIMNKTILFRERR